MLASPLIHVCGVIHVSIAESLSYHYLTLTSQYVVNIITALHFCNGSKSVKNEAAIMGSSTETLSPDMSDVQLYYDIRNFDDL